jgi:hypothetical protein
MNQTIDEIFHSKIFEIESRFCPACNYTQASQKGHICWNWNTSILVEDKYMWSELAFEELLFEERLTIEEVEVIREWLKRSSTN